MSVLRWTPERLAEYQAKLAAGVRVVVPVISPIPALPKPLPPKKRKSKHGNTKVEADGKKFDSKAEFRRYGELCAMQERGEIADLQTQVRFELVPAVVIHGKKKPAIRYYADFTYRKDGALVIEDVKGMKETDVFRIKQHLMAHSLGLQIQVIRVSRG